MNIDASELQELMKDTVRQTVAELKEQQFSLDDSERAYRLTGDRLYAYFSGADYNEALENALESLQGDKYFTVLTAYYGEFKTVAQIAAELKAGRSTIHRNKRRLCIKIAEKMGLSHSGES